MSTLLSVGRWAGDPRSPFLPTLFHDYVAMCLSVPSKTKARGRFHQATLISWATATSVAVSCSVSSWWSFSFFGRVVSLLNRQRVFWCVLKEKKKTEKGVGRCSSFQRWAQPFSLWEGAGPKGLWALGFGHLAQVLTLASSTGWEKLPGQLGCWVPFFTCTPVPPSLLFQHPWDSPSDHIGRAGAASWCLQLPRVILHGVWMSNSQHSKWWHLGIWPLTVFCFCHIMQ